jgi:hypothetical protein
MKLKEYVFHSFTVQSNFTLLSEYQKKSQHVACPSNEHAFQLIKAYFLLNDLISVTKYSKFLNKYPQQRGGKGWKQHRLYETCAFIALSRKTFKKYVDEIHIIPL